MKHLSIRTTDLPREAVLRFGCPYEMGDQFVTSIADVDCESCKTQIKSAQKERC